MLLLLVVLLSVFVVIVSLWGWNISRLVCHPFLALRRSGVASRVLVVDAIFVSLLIVNSSCGAAVNRSEENAAMHGAAASVFTYPSSPPDMVTTHARDLLQGNAQGAAIAQTPATIDFERFDIDPRRYGTDYGAWGNVVLGPDGKYYFGFGDHSTAQGGQDGSLLCSYDPVTRTHSILLFSKDLFGPGGEGKWHGRPDIDPRTGDMYLIGFYQGHIVSYNIYSRRASDLGAPVPGSGWAEHTWDWQRNRLYGVGDGKGSVLVYDTKNKKVIHQGQPVDARTGAPFYWNDRARLLDRETGNLYGTDADNHLTKYDAATNTFTIMRSRLPSRLRAWTNQKEADGSFWIFDDQGDIYKFYPEQDRVEYKGKNWGTHGWYTAFLERSTDGRFLYYSLSNPTSNEGQPILQYDTRTNQRKVIAFLANYYAHTYHYQPIKIYGGALSRDNSSFFVVSDGNIVNGPRIPALFNIHIPVSERGSN